MATVTYKQPGNPKSGYGGCLIIVIVFILIAALSCRKQQDIPTCYECEVRYGDIKHEHIIDTCTGGEVPQFPGAISVKCKARQPWQ